jgi:hypothetical protein
MLIQRKSTTTGKINQMELNVTQAQIDEWQGGELIQNVMPHLSDEEREFLISGMTPAEWNNFVSECAA